VESPKKNKACSNFPKSRLFFPKKPLNQVGITLANLSTGVLYFLLELEFLRALVLKISGVKSS
jgi:hypothetical protein